jgi:hypothetical protein
MPAYVRSHACKLSFIIAAQYNPEQAIVQKKKHFYKSTGGNTDRGIIDISRRLSDIVLVLFSFQLCTRRLDHIKIGKLFNAKYTTAKDCTV